MSTDQQQVIVSSGAAGGGATAQHRDFPEIRAEGGSAQEAAEQLLNHLTRALDTALIDWRRSQIEQAIADVRSFLDTKQD